MKLSAKLLVISLASLVALASWRYLWEPPNRLFLRPDLLDMGTRTCGEVVHIDFAIHNNSHRELHLLGSQSTCACVVAAPPTGEVAPFSTRTMGVAVTVPSEPGPFSQEVSVFVDVDNKLVLLTGYLRGVAVSEAKQHTTARSNEQVTDTTIN